MRILLGAILCWLCSAVAVGQTSLVDIPFTSAKGLMVFPLQVNGSEDLYFIFDTGAGVTVIDSTTAATLALAVSDSATIGTAGKAISSPVSVATLSIGAILIKDVRLHAMNLSHFSRLLGHRIDGIIGYDMLKRYVVETNVATKRIRLYDSATYTYNGKGTAIQFSKVKNNHILIPVKITIANNKEIEVPLIVDTGSDEYIALFDIAIKQYDLLAGNQKFKTITDFSVEGTPTKNYITKVKGLRIGASYWKKVPTKYIVADLNINASAYKASEYGRIGQKILGDCNIVYNYAKSLLYIEKL